MINFTPHFPDNYSKDDSISIMLLGEAPGANEEKLGIPFIGSSGKLLIDTLSKYGWPRSKLFIDNVFWERPPENKVAFFFERGYKLKEEFKGIFDRLESEIVHLKPKLIFALGRIPAWALTRNEKIKVTEIAGSKFEITYGNFSTTIVPIFHPAYMLRNRNMIPLWESHISTAIEEIIK
jgi:DNA polymerase